MRSFLQLFRSATKGVWVDTDATEGAVVGENLFVRLDDGSLALFNPSDGTVVGDDGSTTQVRMSNPAALMRRARGVPRPSSNRSMGIAVGGRVVNGRVILSRSTPGSNSGYSPGNSPATPRRTSTLTRT